MAERALEAMKDRVRSRTAFGKLLAEQDTIIASIAQSRMEIEQARYCLYLSVCLYMCLSVHVPVPVCLSVCLCSACLCVCLPVYIFVYLSVYMSVSVCLSV